MGHTVSKQYLKGYNQGYKLSLVATPQQLKETQERVKASLAIENEFSNGFAKGISQGLDHRRIIERVRDKNFINEIQQMQQKLKDKDYER